MRIIWDRKAQRYRDAKGRFVSPTKIRREIDKGAEYLERQFDKNTDKLLDKRISLAEWQTRNKDELKAGLLVSSSVAKGGWRQMSQSDFGFVGQKTRIQYQALNKFAQEIANGKLSPAQIKARMRSYAASLRSIYFQMEQRLKQAMGKEFAKRHLTNAEHCEPCVDHAGRWIPIDEMPPIGSFPFSEDGCAQFCKCFLTYK